MCTARPWCLPASTSTSEGIAYIKRHESDPNAKLIVLVGVEGEDAKRLERLSEARGKNAAAVVSELLRDADRSAA